MSEHPRLVRLACWACASRYAHVVDPQCLICAGAGVVAAAVPEGVEPIVAARAGSMGPRARVVADAPEAAGLAWSPKDYTERRRVGVKAGRFLQEIGLRKAKPRKPPPTKEQRAAKAAEREANRAALQAWRDAAERKAQERANERRRQEVAARAAKAIADAHPEEFADELQTQEVFVALEEGFGSYLPPAVRRVMEATAEGVR